MRNVAFSTCSKQTKKQRNKILTIEKKRGNLWKKKQKQKTKKKGKTRTCQNKSDNTITKSQTKKSSLLFLGK